MEVEMKPFKGVFPAVVIDNIDPDNSGRVKVRLAQASAPGRRRHETWARIATLMAGKNRGTWFVPDVDDEVLVAFGESAEGQPYVIGGLWSKTGSPPETIGTNNDKKVIRSRNGVKITLNDQSGQESFTVETPGGQKITLQDGPGSLEIIDSNGNSVNLGLSGITVNASAKVTIKATQVEVSSSTITVYAGMSRFSGVVQCDTLISNSVVSASYTPGAGNIM
jgi:uncharacterized protein involved in type VI secretion and phage assembly